MDLVGGPRGLVSITVVENVDIYAAERHEVHCAQAIFRDRGIARSYRGASIAFRLRRV